jgi:mRNA interferase MazF
MQRGEVWSVDFNPTVGSEMRKVRPAVIISRDDVGILPLRVLVPLTGWQAHFTGTPWMVRVEPSPDNGLSKTSAADVFQVRSASTLRFVSLLGRLEDAEMQAIVDALTQLVTPP